MITPNTNLQILQSKIHLPKKELIVEIELNGKMKFEHLMNTIYNQFGICHKVLSANVEYMAISIVIPNTAKIITLFSIIIALSIVS
jgi:hypothetical protein